MKWLPLFYRDEDEDEEAAITDPEGKPVEKPPEPSDSKESGAEVRYIYTLYYIHLGLFLCINIL
jgi:hypothetical protein